MLVLWFLVCVVLRYEAAVLMDFCVVLEVNTRRVCAIKHWNWNWNSRLELLFIGFVD